MKERQLSVFSTEPLSPIFLRVVDEILHSVFLPSPKFFVLLSFSEQPKEKAEPCEEFKILFFFLLDAETCKEKF